MLRKRSVIHITIYAYVDIIVIEWATSRIRIRHACTVKDGEGNPGGPPKT